MALSMEELARRHGVSVEAVMALRDALRRGGGQQAQFSHPDLGGMGQWSAGGMIQIGDMFNTALKNKVAALCGELARDPAAQGGEPASAPAPAPSGDWWPSGLGRPSAVGAQGGMRYACFPDARRMAVARAGRVTVYDTGEHRILGVSQSQSGGQELHFTSQNGSVRVSDLPVAG